MKISIIAAITLDGKIARSANHFPDWTGKADKKIFSLITKKAGTIIMGSKTFDLIGKALPERKTIVLTRNLNRISSNKNLIFTNKSVEDIVSELDYNGCRWILVCGGAQINYLFIVKNLVNELILTFSPVIFGDGVPLFSGTLNIKLELKHIKLIDRNSICAIYKVLK